VDVHQGAAVADCTARAVEPDRVDASGAAVVEVHRAGIGTPADAVGDGQAGEHGGAAAVEFKAIKGPGARRLVVGHRPGPEASLRVAGPVADPHVSAVALALRELLARAGAANERE